MGKEPATEASASFERMLRSLTDRLLVDIHSFSRELNSETDFSHGDLQERVSQFERLFHQLHRTLSAPVEAMQATLAALEAHSNDFSSLQSHLSQGRREAPGAQVAEDVRDKFSRLANEWRTQSRFMSSSTDMMLVPAYQHIIGMGWGAVPLMLRELQEQSDPDHWFAALEAITEAAPVPEEQWGNIKAMADAWVEWGEREGHI